MHHVVYAKRTGLLRLGARRNVSLPFLTMHVSNSLSILSNEETTGFEALLFFSSTIAVNIEWRSKFQSKSAEIVDYLYWVFVNTWYGNQGICSFTRLEYLALYLPSSCIYNTMRFRRHLLYSSIILRVGGHTERTGLSINRTLIWKARRVLINMWMSSWLLWMNIHAFWLTICLNVSGFHCELQYVAIGEKLMDLLKHLLGKDAMLQVHISLSDSLSGF